jgi:hypothetical protein
MNSYPALKTVNPLENYRLELTFAGGEMRVYDFKPNLSHKFYKNLSDVRLFNSVSVADGEITWATGQDFCPHTLYEESVPLN